MKRIILIFLALIAFTSNCFASAPKPIQKVVLFYMVKDEALQCQNSNEDMLAGKEELEKELTDHYNNRFIVQGIERVPVGTIWTVQECFSKVKPNQLPFFIAIALDGQDQTEEHYQNAFGAQKTGVAPAIKVHLMEAIPDLEKNGFYQFDYGVQSYSAGTYAIGQNIYATQTDPRKNAKNAIRASFRDACKFNDSINKYANPKGYEKEYNRFTGNFKETSIVKDK